MGMALYARKKKGPGVIIHSGAFVGVFFLIFWSTLPNEQTILKALGKCF